MKALLQTVFGPHPASMLVAIVVVLLAIKLAVGFFGRKTGKGEPIDGGAGDAFFSGVLLVNALAHFTHGISGEDFAAPFGYLFGPGLISNLSNVLWGFINIALGYAMTVTGRAFGSDRSRTIAFFAGVLVMGVFLSYVFS
jgi:hypothetical protein